MIKYNLICDKEHEFESWFSNSHEFENLKKKKLLECIYCASKKIEKSIMPPMISNSINLDTSQSKFEKDLFKEKKKLQQIRKFIEKNYEFVGKNFSKKVREIYYDKNSKKTIYGTTTPKEREDLAEEGIDLISIPWIDKDN